MTYRLGFLLQAPPHHLPDGHPTVCFYDLVPSSTSHLPHHPSTQVFLSTSPPARLQKGESLQGVRRRRRKAIDSLREKTQVLLLLPVGRDTSLGPDSRNWPGYPTTTTTTSGGTNRWMSFTRFSRQDERGERRKRTSRVCERERREEEIGRICSLLPSSTYVHFLCWPLERIN